MVSARANSRLCVGALRWTPRARGAPKEGDGWNGARARLTYIRPTYITDRGHYADAVDVFAVADTRRAATISRRVRRKLIKGTIRLRGYLGLIPNAGASPRSFYSHPPMDNSDDRPRASPSLPNAFDRPFFSLDYSLPLLHPSSRSYSPSCDLASAVG